MTPEQKNTCIMCRTKLVAKGSKVEIERIKTWAKKGKAWAISMLADRYIHGVGVKQSSTNGTSVQVEDRNTKNISIIL